MPIKISRESVRELFKAFIMAKSPMLKHALFELADDNGILYFADYGMESRFQGFREGLASIAYDKAKAEERIKQLEAMTAVSMGVGDGDGPGFVHGTSEAINKCRELVIKGEKINRIKRILES